MAEVLKKPDSTSQGAPIDPIQKLVGHSCKGMYGVACFIDPSKDIPRFTWDNEAFAKLENSKLIGFHTKNVVVHLGLGQTFHYLDQGSVFVDWGIGQATNYPLSFLPGDINIIPIEPQQEFLTPGVRNVIMIIYTYN